MKARNASSGQAAPRLAGAGARPVFTRRRMLGVWALFVAALAAAVYANFLPTEKSRWVWAMHDRGVHCLAAIKFAVSAASGDFATFFGELYKPKLYPPLQALLGALAGLIAGPHYHVVMLPSLLGWILMVGLGGALAFRLAGIGEPPARFPWWRWLAGAVAAAFLIGSPAGRFYATDTMLESLGAGLTVAVLFAYARVRETADGWRDGPRMRWLALALTLLFFQKYNYWLLVVIALAADLAVDPVFRPWLLGKAREHGPAIVRHLLRQPLLYLAAALLALTFWINYHGELVIHKISLYPPRAILSVAIWVLAAQALLELARLGRERWRALPAGVRAFVGWHILPPGLWILLPGKLWTILFFVGTSNAGDARYPGLAGLRYYLDCLATQYHAAPWTLALAAALALAALFFVRRNAGLRAVLLVLLVSGTLAALHPNKQGRYLHSWIPTLWILSGVGAAMLARALARLNNLAALILSAAAALAFTLFIAVDVRRQPNGFDELAQYPHPPGSLLDAPGEYLPHLLLARHVAFFAQSGKSVVEWTFLEAFGEKTPYDLIDKPHDIAPAEVRAHALDWLRATHADTAVVIRATPGSLWSHDGYDSPVIADTFADVLRSPNSGWQIDMVLGQPLEGTTIDIFTRSGTPGPVIMIPATTASTQR